MKSTRRTSDPAAAGPPADVSVLSTMLRTLVLVALTLLISASARFVPPVVHLVQHVAGTQTWQSVYTLLGIEGALEREQAILAGIVIVSFFIALALQLGGLAVWRALRRRRTPS